MSLRPLLVFVPLLLALSACQQAAWKAGANADDFNRDQQACRAHGSADDALKQCLRGKGWTITEFQSPAANEDAVDNNTAPAVSPSPLSESVSSASAEKSNAQPNTETAMKAAGATENSTAPKPAAKRAAADPLQKQSVQTWWKAGAQAADFDGDAKVCLDQLGEPHTPDYAQHLYTRAMVSCLRARGWLAGQDPVYTPLR